MGRSESAADVPARHLANSGANRVASGLSGLGPRREHHGPDDECRWRLGDALVVVRGGTGDRERPAAACLRAEYLVLNTQYFVLLFEETVHDYAPVFSGFSG